MKRYLILLFALTLMLLTACSFRQANAEEPDKSGSDVQQGEPSREQEQETDSAALSALRQEAAGANCPCAIACPNFETDETTFPAIRDALRMLPAEYVRKVRIYATTLVEIFAQKM